MGPVYGSQMSFIAALAIGEDFQGGKVAYILQSGDPGYVAGQTHGFIAAPSNQSTGAQWYSNPNITTGATGTLLGAGITNTNTIVSVLGTGIYAARLCYDLVLNGYSDWYLPSREELNKLYINRVAIGGFTSGIYWSSSESQNIFASYYAFMNGNTYNTTKSNSYYVRAIRSF